MEAKPTSGTGQASDNEFAMCWKESLKLMTQRLVCGGAPGCHLVNKGSRFYGAPLGHEEFVAAHLEKTLRKHQALFDAIPSVPDVQSAWLLLLHCASSRANYLLRVVRPEWTVHFAHSHDTGLWHCLCNILGIHHDQCEATVRTSSTLSLSMGGLGLRSAVRTSQTAYWVSWADILPMIQRRHSAVADLMVYHLEGAPRTPCLESASRAAAALDGTDGFEVPSWSALASGLRPLPRNPEDHEPGCPTQGWQHEAASRVERQFRSAVLFPSLCDSDRALMRSQSGPGAGVALSATPSSALTRIESALFRVLLLRRLRQPLRLTLCSCGRLLDFRGHHRTTCARSGILSRQGFALESAAARVCREAGARVATNVMVRDMDLNAPNARDVRRLEVVADGLILFGGAQLGGFQEVRFYP